MSGTPPTVVTHIGGFHADDVGAVAIVVLRERRNGRQDPHILRSRDDAVIAAADIAIDVGGEYAALKGRFDHHQAGFDLRRGNRVPYASFGLVWDAYADDILAGFDPTTVRRVKDIVDRKLVQGVDAHDVRYVPALILGGDCNDDNAWGYVVGWEGTRDVAIAKDLMDDAKTNGMHTGIGQYTSHYLPPMPSRPMTISEIISDMNPSWDDKSDDADMNRRFLVAVEFMVSVLRRTINRAVVAIKAEDVIREAITNNVDPQILTLPQFAPWRQMVHEAEEDYLFICFPGRGEDWVVQAVPVHPNRDALKTPFPEAWAGLSGEAFAAESGVSDATFCHRGRFIAGAASREGACALARRAIILAREAKRVLA